MSSTDIPELLMQMEKRLSEQIVASEQRTKSEIMAYIESKVERDIKTIAEGVTTLVNHKPKVDDVAEDVEDLDTRVAAVEHVVRKHNKELDELKKAQ